MKRADLIFPFRGKTAAQQLVGGKCLSLKNKPAQIRIGR